MQDPINNEILDSYNKGFTHNKPTEISSADYQTITEDEPKYITAQSGVEFNPDAPPENKTMHTIEPPKVSTQHF